MRRDIDGVYFRFGTENICWTDLTEEQREEVSKDWELENWKTLCQHLTNTIINISEQFDIVGGEI